MSNVCHHCGAATKITTSWTDHNPGRRFRLCPNCAFSRWYDPPMCPRSVVIIPGLLRRINNLQEASMHNASNARQMKVLLFISWFLFIIYVMFN